MKRRETALPKPCLCVHCGARLDASTNLDNEEDAPEAGDYSMCLHCGCILVYTPDLIVRRAELEDLAKLSKETLLLLMRAQAAQQAVQGQLAAMKKPETKQ